MKVIIDTDLKTDNVTGIAASSEDANFPATNLQNDYTTDLFKAVNGVTEAILTATVSKGSAVEVLNTNATEAVVSAGTGATYELENGYALESGYELEDSESYVTTVYSLPGTAGRLWADYPEIAVPHIVKVVLIAASTVEAGIFRAGNVEEFNDPQYGFEEDSIDYSIEKELNNGAGYFRKRNVVRTFSDLEIIESRANCFKMKMDIFDAVGPKPLAIRLMHKIITDDEYVLFAKRTEPPRIVNDISASLSRLQLSLQEVV
ncbi:MAG: hypothetical protein ACYDHW_10720 [Syntrophorhabdaceae bacterium]